MPYSGYISPPIPKRLVMQYLAENCMDNDYDSVSDMEEENQTIRRFLIWAACKGFNLVKGE